MAIRNLQSKIKKAILFIIVSQRILRNLSKKLQDLYYILKTTEYCLNNIQINGKISHIHETEDLICEDDSHQTDI